MRVTDAIANGNHLQYLYYLLEFLAAWEKRPADDLTPLAYQWCSTISGVARRLGQRETPIIQPWHILKPKSGFQVQCVQSKSTSSQPGLRLPLQQDPTKLDVTSHHTHSGLTPLNCAHLLSISLKIGFHLTAASLDQSDQMFRLDHTPHHTWMFENVFLSHDDDIIADAVCVWIAAGDNPPPGSYVQYFAKRVERDTPFSPRLRRVSIRAIECTWRRELKVSVLETALLLNRLKVDAAGDMEESRLGEMLTDVICSPMGLESLSPHYWRLVDKMLLAEGLGIAPTTRSTVTKSLEGAEDWEKLELWMVIVWRSVLSSQAMEDIEQVTLELLLRRPPALPRFEGLCETGIPSTKQKTRLRSVCDQVRAEQPPSEAPPPYVSARPTDQHLSVLMPPFFLLCSSHTQPLVPLPSLGDDTLLRSFMVFTAGRCPESHRDPSLDYMEQ